MHRFLLLLLLSLSAPVFAVSFDCSKASNFAEKEICRDGYLSGVDSILAGEYRKAMAAASDPAALQASQREWLIVRNQCTVQKCLDTTLSDRIKVLQQYVQREKEQASIAEWNQQQAQREAVEAERLRQQQAAQTQAPTNVPAAPVAIAPPVVKAPPAIVPVPSVQRPAQTQTQAAPRVVAQPSTVQGASGPSLWTRFWEGPAWKYALLILGAVTGSAMVLHRRETLTVYLDYTDAVVANVLPFAGFLVFLLLTWLEVPAGIPYAVLGAAVVATVAFSAWTSIQANDSLWKAMVSLVAKVILVVLFYLCVVFLLFSMLSTKYKDETRAQAAARNRRAHREARAALAGLTVGYTFLTHWLCRYGEFSSLSECLGIEGGADVAQG
ncbi:lysozyme inhibitor LprI family protein [Pseudomonas sp. NPDC088368]|uniref:lysozyme inhibitor LprI family protein n=1 Tax=Pseudomonas sp. NPDC088368 TaxID=3364453 RepID=UPI00380C638C